MVFVRSSPHRYRDRDEAGRVLADLVAERLAAEGDVPGEGRPIVLGLPRGGVPVAAVIADRVGGELDVLCVRKVGTPGQRELALGAVASGGLTVLNDDLIYQLGLPDKAIRRSIEAAEEELAAQEARFRPDRPPLSLGRRVVIVVDDGLATGATMRAALQAVRTATPARLVGAVPVGAPESCQLVEALTDDFVCPLRPPLFSAVGQWYHDFSATSDADVHRLLAEHPRPN
jgi:putative phosphoribosyl transferase